MLVKRMLCPRLVNDSLMAGSHLRPSTALAFYNIWLFSLSGFWKDWTIKGSVSAVSGAS